MIERILKKTMQLFLFAGFAKTNTDEIAKHIGISKRTLYRYYDAKEKLINAVFNFLKEKITAQHEAIIKDKSKNPRQKLNEILLIVTKIGSKMGKPFINDIQNFRPDLYIMMKEFRKERLRRLADIIKEGQESGIFRKELNRELTIDALIAALDGVINPKYLSETTFSISSAFDTIFNIFIHGIENEKSNSQLKNPILHSHPDAHILSFQIMDFDTEQEISSNEVINLQSIKDKKKSTWLTNTN
ncbi:TetR/AcrR family transcriptional regulator [Leptospira alexanderi]|uniref:Transcriptional regulator, TetR family n=1 Tax=Leptospira alexanderi serovar Manhao 3 str. L 60 TaxID=1049759 RepID=V6I824_9LEPT|nr:TetR/AcrR family transcriptional regulator [Leptospira alexanderi]EQA63024.1 transcriptional regulator, TetR family [Leptospira alexanderi serovar Manhao 3 str. L 60]